MITCQGDALIFPELLLLLSALYERLLKLRGVFTNVYWSLGTIRRRCD